MAMSGKRNYLHDFIELGDLESVKIFIKSHDVNEVDDFGETAVFAAVKRAREKILDVLINAGAKVDIKNIFKESPLDIAIEKKYPMIIDMLKIALEKEANNTQSSKFKP